jgi:hypothetical protein
MPWNLGSKTELMSANPQVYGEAVSDGLKALILFLFQNRSSIFVIFFLKLARNCRWE